MEAARFGRKAPGKGTFFFFNSAGASEEKPALNCCPQRSLGAGMWMMTPHLCRVQTMLEQQG